MALDGIVTKAIVHELQSFIGARIGKIYQPNNHDLIFNLRGAGGGNNCCSLLILRILGCILPKETALILRSPHVLHAYAEAL